MFRNESQNHSAPNRGAIPQGKGREGIRKGRGAEIALAVRRWLSVAGSNSNRQGPNARGCDGLSLRAAQ